MWDKVDTLSPGPAENRFHEVHNGPGGLNKVLSHTKYWLKDFIWLKDFRMWTPPRNGKLKIVKHVVKQYVDDFMGELTF